MTNGFSKPAIPFKTIRYKRNYRMGINFSRLDIRTTEKSAWAPVPRMFPTASLAYTGILVWDKTPPDPGANVSLIPYALAGTSKILQPVHPRIIVTRNRWWCKNCIKQFSQSGSYFQSWFFTGRSRSASNQSGSLWVVFPEKRQFFFWEWWPFANIGSSTPGPFFTKDRSYIPYRCRPQT